MGAPSKRARKVRAKSEFDLTKLATKLGAPRNGSGVYAWDLASIYSARDSQMRGMFQLAARMAESMRTDDALFVALQNRLAPQKALNVEMVPAKGVRGESVAREADALFGRDGVGLTGVTIADIQSSFVNHGLAIGYNCVRPREDGTRVDIEHVYWPIEFVRWDETLRCLMARIDYETVGQLPTDMVRAGGDIPIVHGDGTWTIYAKTSHLPWRHGALLPASMVWARHAFGLRDWAKSSLTHGLAKVIGELPPGVALQDDNGVTPEAAAFLSLLTEIANSDLPIGIRPSGSKTEFIANSSNAWQIFSNLVENADKAAARIYLGTDGTLGAQGGAPGVDISALFGVASTIVQGDLEILENGILTGVIEPWCAMNFGDSSLAPKRKYVIPDPDEDRDHASYATRRTAFYADVSSARAGGFVVDQAFVDAAARKHGVDAPMLPVVVQEPAQETTTPAPEPVAPPAVASVSAEVLAVLSSRASTDDLVMQTLSRLADALNRIELAKGRDGVAGPPGPEGRPGQNGKDGQSITGPAGPQGNPGRDGKAGRDAEEISLSFAQRSAAFLEDVETTRNLTGKLSRKTFERLARAHGVDPAIYGEEG